MDSFIKIDRSIAGVLQLLIDRPDKKNALDQQAYQELVAALEVASHAGTVHVVVLSGCGGQFTSGNDLADFQGEDAPGAEPALCFLRALSRFDKPLIAAVEGYAVGIGTTLLLHCDLAYAGRSARFVLPFINLALCPEGAASYLLPLMAGSKTAAELLLLGEPFLAERALKAGLLNAVSEDGAALEQALARASQLAAKSPAAVRATKRLLKRGTAAAVAETLELELAQFQQLLELNDAQHCLQAFFQRRPAAS
jgi:enoyl-CoA hydratase/carnithine racemase